LDELEQRAQTEPLLQVVSGDVYDFDALTEAMRGCRAAISSASTPRITHPMDALYKVWDPNLEFLGAWGYDSCNGRLLAPPPHFAAGHAGVR
jgi:hypothetical protein